VIKSKRLIIVIIHSDSKTFLLPTTLVRSDTKKGIKSFHIGNSVMVK